MFDFKNLGRNVQIKKSIWNLDVCEIKTAGQSLKKYLENTYFIWVGFFFSGTKTLIILCLLIILLIFLKARKPKFQTLHLESVDSWGVEGGVCQEIKVSRFWNKAHLRWSNSYRNTTWQLENKYQDNINSFLNDQDLILSFTVGTTYSVMKGLSLSWKSYYSFVLLLWVSCRAVFFRREKREKTCILPLKKTH